MSARVLSALSMVREAKAAAEHWLSPVEQTEFLGELLADAEGWRMELEDKE